MGLNITQKLFASHLVAGGSEPRPGQTVTIRISQTLAHDESAEAVLAHLDRLGAGRTRCDLSIFYVDHDLLAATRNAFERNRALRAAAQRRGAYLSRPGNGVSHQVHLERMATPGRTLLGAAAHTRAVGAVGMLAMVSGVADVAAAMAGEALRVVVPEVIRVALHGKARPFIAAQDIGLELIRRRGVGGCTGRVLEFDGPGARAMGVYERATVADLCGALGCVAAIFPSDEKTRIFLQRQRRSKSWRRLEPDADASYTQTETVDLGALEPLVLCSASTVEIRPVRELTGDPVQEVVVGPCTSGTIRDLLTLAGLVRGKKVHADCTFTVSPASRQTLEILARSDSSESGGSLADLVSAGVRLVESGCGACERPHGLPDGSTSARTSVGFLGAAAGGRVLVVSPETAAACAIHGQVTDPRKLRRPPRVKLHRQLPVDDSMIIKPTRAEPRARDGSRPARPAALTRPDETARVRVARRVARPAAAR
jgi:aconitate hydratase